MDISRFDEINRSLFTDSIMLSLYYTPITENDESCTSLEYDLFPSLCTTFKDTIDFVEPGDIHDDIVFDQYLRSPSPSPRPLLSADDASSELSRGALINAECYQRGSREEPSREPFRELSEVEFRSPGPEHAPEKQEAGYQENISHLNSGLRIRLRVRQPKTKLRLKLPATRQAGMKKRREGRQRRERTALDGGRERMESRAREQRE